MSEHKREYEDVEKHLARHMQRAAARYVDGLQKAGLEPNETLMKALAERTLREAAASYTQEATDVRDHNIDDILSDHRQRMNVIKRSGAKMRLLTCPPIALLLGLLAWYNFHTGSILLGVFYVFGSLAFFAMLILGAIFDKPDSERI